MTHKVYFGSNLWEIIASLPCSVKSWNPGADTRRLVLHQLDFSTLCKMHTPSQQSWPWKWTPSAHFTQALNLTCLLVLPSAPVDVAERKSPVASKPIKVHWQTEFEDEKSRVNQSFTLGTVVTLYIIIFNPQKFEQLLRVENLHPQWGAPGNCKRYVKIHKDARGTLALCMHKTLTFSRKKNKDCKMPWGEGWLMIEQRNKDNKATVDGRNPAPRPETL